jgi:hypothetical protein
MTPTDLQLVQGDATSIPEETAFAAYQTLREARTNPELAASPALATSREALKSYVTERRRHGHDLFPNVTTAANRERNDSLAGLYTKPLEKALPQQAFADLTRKMEFVPDPEAFKMREINRTFLSATVGQAIPPEKYDTIRTIYAKQHLGLDKDTSEAAVFTAIKTRFDEELGSTEKIREIAKGEFESILGGTLPTTLPDLSAIPERLRPQVSDQILATRRQSKERIRQAMPAVREIMPALQAEAARLASGQMQGLPHLALMDRMAAALPRDPVKKEIAIALIAREMQKLPEQEKGAFARILTSIERGGDNAAMSAIRAPMEAGAAIRDMIPAGAEQKRTAADNLTIRTDAENLRKAFLGEVDPLRRAGDNIAVQSLVLAGESAWTIPATLSGPIGWGAMASSFAGNSFQEARTINPDASAGAQIGAAAASGVAQAGAEVVLNKVGFKIIGGKLPGLAGILNKSGVFNPAARATIAGATGAVSIGATEYAEEAVQGGIDRLAQDLALEFSNIAPDTDWKGFWGDWLTVGKAEQKDTLLAVLPFAVVGAGGASFQHFRYGSQLAKNRTVLDAIGVPSSVVDEMVNTTDVKKTDELFRQAWETGLEERTQEQKAAALDVMREINSLTAAAGLDRITRDSEFTYTYTDPLTRDSQEFETEEEALLHWRQQALSASQTDLDTIALTSREDLLNFLTSEGKASEETMIDEQERTLTLPQAVKEGIANPEQIESRVRIFILQNGLTPAQAAKEVESLTIRARSYTQQSRDGQYRYAVQLFKNADPLDVFEDFAEDSIKRAFDDSLADPRRILRDIRDYEGASNTRLIAQDYEYDPDNTLPLVEGFSALARALVIGNARADLLPPAVSQWIEVAATYGANTIDLARSAITADLTRAGELKKALASGNVPTELVSRLEDAIGINETEVLARLEKKHRDQLAAEAMGGFPEIRDNLEGRMPHPETLRKNQHPLAGEVRRIWESMKKPTRRKDRSGRTIDRSNEANAFFLPVGQMVDIDKLRESMNEKGFDFDTPADMLDALESSISYNKPVYGTGSRGNDSFSIGTTYPRFNLRPDGATLYVHSNTGVLFPDGHEIKTLPAVPDTLSDGRGAFWDGIRNGGRRDAILRAWRKKGTDQRNADWLVKALSKADGWKNSGTVAETWQWLANSLNSMTIDQGWEVENIIETLPELLDLPGAVWEGIREKDYAYIPISPDGTVLYTPVREQKFAFGRLPTTAEVAEAQAAHDANPQIYPSFSIGRAIPRAAKTFEEARESARSFIGKPIVNADDNTVATISANSLRKILHEKASSKSVSPEVHSLVTANLDTLFERSIRTHSDTNPDGDNMKARHRYHAPFISGGEVMLAKITVNEFKEESDGTRIYSVEAMEIVKPAIFKASSISEDRRNYNRVAGFEEKLESRIAEVNNQPSVESSFSIGRATVTPTKETQTSPTKDGDSFSIGASPAPFYSQLERVIEDKLPKAATFAQIMATIDPAKGSGVKAEEIKWSGIESEVFRLALDNDKVKKSDLLAYLAAAGRVEFAEVTMSDPQRKGAVYDWAVSNGEENTYFRSYQEAAEYADQQGINITEDTVFQATNRRRDSTNPKYEQYTLPGGENYRETVLRLPQKGTSYTEENVVAIDPAAPIAGRPDLFWYFEVPGNVLQIPKSNHPTQAEAKTYILRDKQPKEPNSYTSSHFPEISNYVAHMRLNEREDSQGAPGLFIEEIQSDRHQAGRKKGYALGRPNENDIELNFIKSVVPEGQDPSNYPGYWESFDKRTGEMITRHPGRSTREQAMRDAQGFGEGMDSERIADAPFRTTWPLAMFKRALREAVESGKDWIGWTVGETQNDRFDLSKQVRHIDWRVSSESNREAVKIDVGVATLQGGDAQDLNKEALTYSEIADFVGKEIADRIKTQVDSFKSKGRLEGDGLKVGGSGMKGFYDNMLPKEIGKYVKQWGGKVESSTIGQSIASEEIDMGELDNATPEELAQLEADGAIQGKAVPIHRVTITPQMRESVAAGQPSFSIGTRRVMPTNYPQSAREIISTTNVKGITHALLKPGEQLVILDEEAEKPMMVSPAYKAAKREGDKRAAWDIARLFLTGKRVAPYKAALGDRSPVFVPIRQEEGAKQNLLPIAAAWALQQQLGGRVANTVLQLKKGGLTGADNNERSKKDHDFEGALEIQPGETVVLIDDTFTSGSTLTSLYDHLSSQGIEAEHIFSIASGRYTKNIAASDEQITRALDKVGMSEEEFQRATGIPIQAFTGAELAAYSLNGARGIEGFALRFDVKGNTGSGSMVPGSDAGLDPSFSLGINQSLLQPLIQGNGIDAESEVSNDGQFRTYAADYATSTGRYYRFVKMDDNGQIISALYVKMQGTRSKKGVISGVYTDEEHRRQGHAGSLLRYAQKNYTVKHSFDLTSDGRAFKKADGVSYSLGPAAFARLEQAIAAKMTAAPDERAEYYSRVRDRLAATQQRLEDMDNGIGVFARLPTDEAGEERRRIQDAIAEARAIIGALPPDARGRVEMDFEDITSKTTEKGRVKALIRLMDKADIALEKVLQSAYLESITRVLDLAQPDLRQNRSVRGRLTPETQRLINAILPLTRLTPIEASAEQIAAQASFDALDNQFPDPEDDAAVDAWERSLAAAQERLDLIDTFASLSTQTSAELAAARKHLLQIYTKGRTARQMLDQAKRSETASERREVIESLGGLPSQSKWKKRVDDKGFLDRMEGYRLGLVSFHEMMEWMFPNSIAARDYQKRIRDSERSVTRARIDARQRWENFAFTALNLTGRSRKRRLNQIIATLSTARDDWNIEIAEGRRSESVKMSEEQAASILDGTLKPGWEKDLIAMESLRQALADFRLKRKAAQDQDKAFQGKVIRFERVTQRGAPTFLRMSDMEAVYFLQLAAQSQYLPALDKYGFTEKVLNQIRAKIDPRALTIMSHLRGEYDMQYQRLNPVHQRLFGLDMPQIRNYAPGAFESMDGKQDPNISPDGTGGALSAMSAGFTKARTHHMARPRQANALALYWSSLEQTEHFIAWAEVMRDMRQIFRSPDVRRTLEAAYGSRAGAEFSTWLDILETDGRSRAAESLSLTQTFNQILTAQSAIGLAFNIGTVFKQWSAGIGHFMLMPTGAAVKATYKALTSPKSLRYVWNSEAVQQRITQGISPEDRRLMDAANASPSLAMELLEIGRLPISLADGAFTTLMGAAAYRYQYDEATKNGLTDSQAHTAALAHMDMVITRAAQPATTQDKSLAENTARGFGKALFLFKSDPRQKFAIAITAIRLATRGDLKTPEAIRRVFFSWAVYGLMAQIAADMWRSISRDDDDLELWEPKDYIAAMIAGPLAGVPILGAAMESTIRSLVGSKAYTNNANPIDKAASMLFRDGGFSSATINAMSGEDVDLTEILAAATRDAGSISQLLAIVSPATAIVPAGLRAVRDVVGIGSNVIGAFSGDTPEDIAARIVREEKEADKKPAENRKQTLDTLAKELAAMPAAQREKRLRQLDADTRTAITSRLRKADMTPSERSLASLPAAARAKAIARILAELPEEDRKPYQDRLESIGLAPD